MKIKTGETEYAAVWTTKDLFGRFHPYIGIPPRTELSLGIRTSSDEFVSFAVIVSLILFTFGFWILRKEVEE